MKIFIAYSNRSCVTGKALRESLKAKRKRTDRRARCDLLLRWGNTEEFSNLRKGRELNSIEAVKLATNKLEMLRTLAAAEIPVPLFGTELEGVDTFKDKHGNLYIRNKRGVVRYANDFNPVSDSYYTKPVLYKRREYRVHVFMGKVIGIYEKVPFDSEPENRPKLFKSDTCRFIKSDPAISRVDPAAQEVCIRAVKALGLDFGGVDIIRDKDKNFFICEVNSSPGLNGMNIERWTKEITDLLGA
jgi:glutathione synthase/RimK-type ligase-like ATP-grasp enzyme